MRIAIAGGHGQIALQLTRLLHARGDEVIGLIRNPAHADDVRGAGGESKVCDLESASVDDVAEAIRGADAAVFAAGAGPGSGAERKLTVDRDGAIKLLAAAVAAGAPRYVIVSSIGAENPPDGDDVFSVYLRAKAEADAAVRGSDREWTIVRPGALTDDPGTGRVRISTDPFRAKVPREDVAAVLEAVLGEHPSIGKIFYLNGGDQPIEQALEAIA
ncbi:MAG: NAD(P)H-binding protein [Solirubrobacteraceae bacterium]